MVPGGDDEYDVEQLVNDALARNLGELDRLVDAEDGEWLFETTGDAQMVFGGWNMDDLMEAIEPDEELEEEVDDAEPDTEPDVEDNPVFDHVESLVNNISYTVEGGEMRDIEARFSGIYPDDQVPTEDDVREYLLGDSDVPHDVVIDGNRVHTTATFEEPTG